MSRAADLARENGWAQVLPRLGASLFRQLRDGFTARRLSAPGFRAGRFPKLGGLSHMRVGRDFHAGDGLWLEAVTAYAGQTHRPELVIGDGVGASDAVHIACLTRIEMGSGTLIGSRVLISDHAHGVYAGIGQSSPETPPGQRPLFSPAPVFIGRNVWLGDGVAVLAGAHIGDGCIIGANAVVTGLIPAGTIAAGAPARVIRRWNAAAAEWQPLPPES